MRISEQGNVNHFLKEQNFHRFQNADFRTFGQDDMFFVGARFLLQVVNEHPRTHAGRMGGGNEFAESFGVDIFFKHAQAQLNFPLIIGGNVRPNRFYLRGSGESIGGGGHNGRQVR